MSLETAAVSEATSFIDLHVDRRQVNRVLHGFPSPRFWRPGNISVPDIMRQRDGWNRSQVAPFSLYVGLPYCIRTDPDRCGYCLFPVETFEGAHTLDTYLDYLEREGELFRDFFAGRTPESIYVGGGTPNLMKPTQYTRLMDIVRSVFPGLTPQTPITMEGIPQLFTREKVEYMKMGGVTRISMGVQQLNTELNRLSGRKQTSKHVFDAIGWVRDLGLQCNVDLIFGWPRQTLQTLVEDLEQMVATGVDHIAHYELNVGGATDFALNRREELPSPELTREMYRTARDFLTASGYRQLTVYDFEKKSPGSHYTYEECKRTFDRTESWGWGFAGVSDFGGGGEQPGWTYVNHRRLRDYFAAIDRREFPVERGFARSIEDLRLNELFRGLQGMRIDRASYTHRFGSDVHEDYRTVWDAVVDRGWCNVTTDTIELVDDGSYYVPLIQDLLSQQRLEQLRSTASAVTMAL